MIRPQRAFGGVDGNEPFPLGVAIPVDDHPFLRHKGIQKGASFSGQPLHNYFFAFAIEAYCCLDGSHILKGGWIGGCFCGQTTGETSAGIKLGQRCQQATGVVGARVIPLEVGILCRLLLNGLPTHRLVRPPQLTRHAFPGNDHNRANGVANLAAGALLPDRHDAGLLGLA